MSNSLASIAVLINAVFSPTPPTNVKKLNWYYQENPEGTAVVGEVVKNGTRLGNYALIPFRFDCITHEGLKLGLGVDLAVHPKARGDGTFRATVEDSYNKGVQKGLDGILGVANNQSSPRMVKTLGWQLLDPIPLKILIGTRTSTPVENLEVNSEFLASGRLHDLLPERSPHYPDSFTATWSPELLTWRLAHPEKRYTIHISEYFVVISTKITLFHFPISVILKVLPRTKTTTPISGNHLVGIVSIYHRTPIVAYWGINQTVRFHGFTVPRRLMPKPLDLVLHSFSDYNGKRKFDSRNFKIGGFEFLDFDAF